MQSDDCEDQRYCASCDAYVFYLLSPATAYCSWCGNRVALCSAADLVRLREASGKRGGPERRATESEYQDAS